MFQKRDYTEWYIVSAWHVSGIILSNGATLVNKKESKTKQQKTQ